VSCKPLDKNGAYKLIELPRGESSLPKRFLIAEEQADKQPVPIKKIIEYVDEFLKALGMSPLGCERVELQPFGSEGVKIPYRYYHSKKEEYGSKYDKRDIIWMKFTKKTGKTEDEENGFLVNVACGADITGVWKNRTCGEIINHLNNKKGTNKKFVLDKSFALVFPLKGFPEDAAWSELKWRTDRHRIETGIGNYLICRGVPILDYYSHMF